MTELNEIGMKEIKKPFVFFVNGVPHIAVPEKYAIREAEEWLPRPSREKRSVALVDVDSFKAYIDKHKTDRAAIHVHMTWPKCSDLAVCFMDDGDNVTTSWHDHLATLTPAIEKNFMDWMSIDCKDATQLELVRFLDRHLSMIVQPDETKSAPSAADVMTFVSNLSDVRKVEFKKSVNLDNGRVQLTYNEVDGGTNQITIPREFWIETKPIVGLESAYRIKVALRYKIVDGAKLVFTIELRDIDKLLEALRSEIITDLQTKITDCPIYLTA